MNKLEITLKDIDDLIDSIKTKTKNKLEGLDKDQSLLVKAIADNTIDVLNKTKEIVNKTSEKIMDTNQLNSFLDRIELQCLEAKTYCLNSLDQIRPIMNEQYIKHKSTMENFINNENVKNVSKLLNDTKDGVFDFVNKPDTKKTIKKIKMKILDGADKGLDALLKLLDDNKKNN